MDDPKEGEILPPVRQSCRKIFHWRLGASFMRPWPVEIAVFIRILYINHIQNTLRCICVHLDLRYLESPSVGKHTLDIRILYIIYIYIHIFHYISIIFPYPCFTGAFPRVHSTSLPWWKLIINYQPTVPNQCPKLQPHSKTINRLSKLHKLHWLYKKTLQK